MKISAKDVVKYRGCSRLYQFHVNKYGRGNSVEFEQFLRDIDEWITNLPPEDDRSWVDPNHAERFLGNYEAIENCGESIEYFNEYKAYIYNKYILAPSIDEVKKKIKDEVTNFIGNPLDFFNVCVRCEMELLGKEGIAIFDIDDPRTDNLKIIDYVVTKRDATKVYMKSQEELNTLLEVIHTEYINKIVNETQVFQKLIADEKYVAWKPIP